MARLRDIGGQRFGSLVALRASGRDSTGKTKWLCACDCGNTTEPTMLNLVNGVAKSCGCLKNQPSARRLDLSGQRFGMLTALTPADGLKWLCHCACGKTTIVRTVHLTRSHTRSCGCLAKAASGEMQAKHKQNNQRVAWANAVKASSQKACAACGKANKLHSHHIVPYSMSDELRFDIENGIVLCHNCHWDTHRLINDGASPGGALAIVVGKYETDETVKGIYMNIARYKEKNGLEDLKKARHYLDKLIEVTAQKGG